MEQFIDDGRKSLALPRHINKDARVSGTHGIRHAWHLREASEAAPREVGGTSSDVSSAIALERPAILRTTLQ